MRGKLGLVVGGVSAASMAVSHWLAFALDSSTNAHLTQQEAPRIIGLAVALIVGVVVFFLHRREIPIDSWDAARRQIASRSLPILLLQMGGFVVMEVLERLASSAATPLTAVDPTVLVGLLFQLAVAVACGVLLLLLAVVVRGMLERRLRPPSHLRRSRWSLPRTAAAYTVAWRASVAPRGPPSIS